MSNIPVGAYTFSDSYLRRLKKDELIEHYRTLERNWFNEIESSNIQIKNSKKLLKEEYNNAIDDFYNALADDLTWLMGFGEEVYISVGDNVRIRAEQLKAGVKNELLQSEQLQKI